MSEKEYIESLNGIPIRDKLRIIANNHEYCPLKTADYSESGGNYINIVGNTIECPDNCKKCDIDILQESDGSTKVKTLDFDCAIDLLTKYDSSTKIIFENKCSANNSVNLKDNYISMCNVGIVQSRTRQCEVDMIPEIEEQIEQGVNVNSCIIQIISVGVICLASAFMITVNPLILIIAFVAGIVAMYYFNYNELTKKLILINLGLLKSND